MSNDAPSIVLIAGEASGDLHGAHLAAEIKRRLPAARIWGVGGRKMAEAGVELLYDSSTWSAIGIAEGIKVGPRLLRTFYELKIRLRNDSPNVLILIDFGFFNVRLAKGLRLERTKVLYYFPPGSWRRNASYQKLKGVADVIVTPFSWSAEVLQEQGFCAKFFGHPLLDIVRPKLTRKEFCEYLGLDSESEIIGLLPGSRAHELRYNLLALLGAAEKISKKFSKVQFVIPLAQSVNPEEINKKLSRYKGTKLFVATDITYETLAYSRAAAIVSGTATIEAAILGCPMVIIYKGSKFLALEYKMRRKAIKFIGMPNIILDRLACPELIQEEASPERISELMAKLISQTPEREKMKADLAEVKALLGSPGAVEKTADLVIDLLSNKEHERIR